tara:strand:- start:2708 stop:3127 length:420 start_codon:yes stop_codon:yes gene_type:complete
VQLKARRDEPLLDPVVRWTLVATLCSGLLAARFFPFEALPALCPIRRITSWPCLGCGGTRAWVEMAHLNVSGAFLQSPLGASCFIAAVALLLYLLGRSWGFLPAIRLQHSRREGLALRLLGAILLAVHWAYLIISGVAT